METLHYAEVNFGFGVPPAQRGVCIKHRSTGDMTSEFLKRMLSMITDFVYDKSMQDSITSKKLREGHTIAQSFTELALLAENKFRKYGRELRDEEKVDVQGQFSELLLFVFLQAFFDAVPVVRKMRLTTSSEFERHGFDALHLSYEDGKYHLYVGEAKTYDRKDRPLRNAVADAVEGVIEHYHRLNKELGLYIYEEFIPEEIEQIVKDYFYRRHGNFEEHLVCVCSYVQDAELEGFNPEEKNQKFLDLITQATQNMRHPIWKDSQKEYLPKIHLIMFPVNKLGDLLKRFRANIRKP
jgi:hypothetical protein